MRLYRILIGFFLFIVTSQTSLYGYVLPGQFVIELMLEQMQLPQRMTVHQVIEIPGEEYWRQDSEETLEYEQVTRYLLPGRFRSEIESDFLSRIHVASADISLTVLDNVVVSETPDWQDLYKDLFLYQSRQQLVDRLSSHGVDTDISSFGRIDNIACYVIGARFPDLGAPQLWIEKSSFRPVRWILEPSDSGIEPPAAEVQYSNWRRVDGTWFPGKISFFEHGRQIRLIKVKEMEINPSFPAGVFDARELKEKYQQEPPLFPDESSTEIQQQIEQFKKLYE